MRQSLLVWHRAHECDNTYFPILFWAAGGGLFSLPKLPFALPWLQIVQEVEKSQELVQVEELHAATL